MNYLQINVLPVNLYYNAPNLCLPPSIGRKSMKEAKIRSSSFHIKFYNKDKDNIIFQDHLRCEEEFKSHQ